MSISLTWLGGANRDTLERLPSAEGKFQQMALVLLTTASLASVSMTFAMHDALKADWVTAGLLGVFWGLIVLNIDRFLVMTLGSTKGKLNLLLVAVPRLAMAAVVSLAVSTPLELRIFRSDIQAQIYSTQLQRSADESSQLSNSLETKELAKLNTQIAADQSTLDGNLPSDVTDPEVQRTQQQVQALTGQVQQAQAARDAAYEAWQCELYGAGATCKDASAQKGSGPLAEAKQREYQETETNLASLTQQLQQAQAGVQQATQQLQAKEAGALAAAQQQAKNELPGLRDRQAKLQAQVQKVTDQGSQVNYGDTGLLAQLSGLRNLTAHDSTLADADFVVRGLFFLIEILPVLIKLIMCLQPPTAYDSMLRASEDESVELARSRRIEARAVDETRSRARLAAEEDMCERQVNLSKRANEHVEARMQQVLDRALDEWSARVDASLAGTAAPTVKTAGPGWRRFAGAPVAGMNYVRGMATTPPSAAAPHATPAADEPAPEQPVYKPLVGAATNQAMWLEPEFDR